mmetsp:Transcript_17376/g.29421  ORF Transcript_17376/g.29421 Transcript_17376/m.29421 type:complete len:104 (+) Transcript_17376:226-537(+)
MVQYAESLHKLQELLKKEANEWTPGRLVISIATSLTNDNQIELDFSPTIGHRKNKPRNPSDDNCHWLPAHLNQNTEMFRVNFKLCEIRLICLESQSLTRSLLC